MYEGESVMLPGARQLQATFTSFLQLIAASDEKGNCKMKAWCGSLADVSVDQMELGS